MAFILKIQTPLYIITEKQASKVLSRENVTAFCATRIIHGILCRKGNLQYFKVYRLIYLIDSLKFNYYLNNYIYKYSHYKQITL